MIGCLWVGLTVLFEFSLGRIVNRSWENLLQDYNLMEGRIWLLFLLCLLLLPFALYHIKKD